MVNIDHKIVPSNLHSVPFRHRTKANVPECIMSTDESEHTAVTNAGRRSKHGSARLGT